jgi:2-polyprenyl-3-methyl-5-hydroxy-6-metoxy-1,4-benzoquinol methylase
MLHHVLGIERSVRTESSLCRQLGTGALSTLVRSWRATFFTPLCR